MASRILIADDDRAIRESLGRALHLEGYNTVLAADGASALDCFRQGPFDLAILDYMMPNIDGLTVCRVLRAERATLPILILTARTETSDRVAGLDAGADDYMAKPFDLDELFARVRALLRRSYTDIALEMGGQSEGALDDRTVLTVGDLRVDTAARRVWRADHEVILSKTEFDLLEFLVANEGVVLTHAQIYARIWGYDFGPDSKNLAVYIGYLRRKIDEGTPWKLIHTVRGVGYTVRSR